MAIGSRRSHRSWVVVRGLGLSHRISFLALELVQYIIMLIR